MSDAELDRLTARTQILGPGKNYSRAWFKGWRRGRKVDPSTEWSFREMKQAWRDGTWWKDPDMRWKYLIMTGGILLILCVFLLFALLFQLPSIRLVLCASVIYALVRLTISVWRA